MLQILCHCVFDGPLTDFVQRAMFLTKDCLLQWQLEINTPQRQFAIDYSKLIVGQILLLVLGIAVTFVYISFMVV